MSVKQTETSWTTALISLFIFFVLAGGVYAWFSNHEVDAKAVAYNKCMSDQKMINTAELAAAYNGHKGNMFKYAYLQAMCEKETA